MRGEELSAAIAAYLEKGGHIRTLQGFTAPSPPPARRAWIDPETKFRRNDRHIKPMHAQMLSTAERKRLKAMADAL